MFHNKTYIVIRLVSFHDQAPDESFGTSPNQAVKMMTLVGTEGEGSQRKRSAEHVDDDPTEDVAPCKIAKNWK